MNRVEYQDWLKEQFNIINQKYFDNKLPPTTVIITITPYGKSLGDANNGMSTIRIHPQTINNYSQEYVLDVLLHECIHINIDCNLGGHSNKRSSHQSIEWVNECNRIAPILGLGHLKAGLPKSKRIKIDGESKVRKVMPDECVPLKNLATFPSSWRDDIINTNT